MAPTHLVTDTSNGERDVPRIPHGEFDGASVCLAVTRQMMPGVGVGWGGGRLLKLFWLVMCIVYLICRIIMDVGLMETKRSVLFSAAVPMRISDI